MRACVWVLAFAWILFVPLATGSRADDVSFPDAPLEEVSALLEESRMVMPLSFSDAALPLVRFDTKAVYPIDLDVLIQLQVARLALDGIQPAGVGYDSGFEFELGGGEDPLAPLLERKADPLEALSDPLSLTGAPTIEGP